MKKIFLFIIFFTFIGSAIASDFAFIRKVSIATSIPPIQKLIKNIGGGYVTTTSLMDASQNPETFEPSPKDVENIAKADFYLSMNLDFEQKFLPKLENTDKNLTIIDLRNFVPKRDLDGAPDPHIWTSTDNMQKIAQVIYQKLVAKDPQHKTFFQQNYQKEKQKLQTINQQIAKILKPIKNRYILVFHPVFGYYLDQYSIQQLSVEKEGKEIAPHDIENLANLTKTKGITVLFAEPQFGSNAETTQVANMLKTKIINLDPLKEDYEQNLIEIARTIRANCH